MAKKAVDLEVQSQIRETWIARFDIAIENTLKALEKQSKDIHDKARELTHGFYNSRQVSYRVGQEVLDMVQRGNSRSALVTVHKAINTCQELSSFYRLVATPSLLDISNDAVFIYNKTLHSFKSDTDVSTYYSSNADIEREASFICILAERYVDNIALQKEKIDSYAKFVDEQMYSLSRLDTLLRTNEKMIFSESFGKSGSNYLLNNVPEDLDEEPEISLASYKGEYVVIGLDEDGDIIDIGAHSTSQSEIKENIPPINNTSYIIGYVEDDEDNDEGHFRTYRVWKGGQWCKK